MIRRVAIVLAVACACAGWPGAFIVSEAAAQPLPRVRLVATGGTISNRYQARLTAEELVASIPAVTRYARPEFEQFANTASSALTLEQWLALSRRLNELFRAQADLAGIVVTSGTDTLEELAYFLNLTIRDERPVVVVGSMRNPSTIGYEGAANLLQAFRVAASPDARGKGALVVMNDEINAARDVTKTDALRLHTFQSRTTGILGVVDADAVVFYRSPVGRHSVKSEFDVSSITELPRVDVILTYQGAGGDLIKAAVDLGAKGLVMATAGAGATSGTQREGITYAYEKGVFVVTTTRTGSGRIAGGRTERPDAGVPPPADPRPASAQAPPRPARPRSLSVAGEDLAPVKARILLMLALTRTADPAEIQRMFIEY